MFDLTVMELLNAREHVQASVNRDRDPSRQISVQLNDVGVMLQCQCKISDQDPIRVLDAWMNPLGVKAAK